MNKRTIKKRGGAGTAFSKYHSRKHQHNKLALQTAKKKANYNEAAVQSTRSEVDRVTKMADAALALAIAKAQQEHKETIDQAIERRRELEDKSALSKREFNEIVKAQTRAAAIASSLAEKSEKRRKIINKPFTFN
jgi:hypothetical protein